MTPDQYPLPRVMHEAGAAVLLVDLRTNHVVYANPYAMAMSGEQRLPMETDEWGRRAGLVDPTGRDLCDTAGPLSRVARGEPVAGEMVRREPRRASQAAGAEQKRQREAGTADVADVVGPLWVTGFPVTRPEADDGQALVVFLRLSGEAALAAATGGRDAALRDRAVIATDLSFTITDPTQDDEPLVWVNPAFTRTTGYSFEESVGRNCRFLQGPATDPAQVARLRAALQSSEATTVTLLNYRKDGTAFWSQVSVSPVYDPDGRVVNHVGVQVDVTERVLAEQEKERAYAAERRARSRLALLVAVSDAVAELDGPRALRQLADLLVRELVTWAVVVLSDGDLEVVSEAGLAEGQEVVGSAVRLPRPLRTGEAVVPDADPMAAVLAGAAPGDVHDLDLQADHPDGTVTRWLAVLLGARATGRCLVLPVRGRREVLGLLLVGPPHADGGAAAAPAQSEGLDDVAAAGMAPDDVALLLEVVRRTGMALDNVRLYTREHVLAETLQRAMLPEQATVPGLDVWAYYAPNVEHAQVGGDWYDVMQPGEDVAGIAIGDVVGHDVEAAAAMGQLRSVVRSYAYELEDPGSVLMRVDQLARGMRIPRMASVVYATMRRVGDGTWELAWSSAGHLPPLLRSRDDGVKQLTGAEGMLVGLGDSPRSTAEAVLGPGDVLVLYTDGLIERRRRPMPVGLEALERVLEAVTAPDAAGIGEELLAALGDSPEDDTAVVVVRIPHADEAVVTSSSSPRQRRFQLPPEPASIARARHATTRTAASWGIPPSPAAELVVSELVANAVLHGWGQVGLRLYEADGGLRIEVEDANPKAPQPVPPRDHGEGGHGLHVVGRLARWGWTPVRGGKVVWAHVPAEALSSPLA